MIERLLGQVGVAVDAVHRLERFLLLALALAQPVHQPVDEGDGLVGEAEIQHGPHGQRAVAHPGEPVVPSRWALLTAVGRARAGPTPSTRTDPCPLHCTAPLAPEHLVAADGLDDVPHAAAARALKLAQEEGVGCSGFWHWTRAMPAGVGTGGLGAPSFCVTVAGSAGWASRRASSAAVRGCGTEAVAVISSK
ncbi:hypothetical protein AQJ58_17855 [Streptomyces sp. DSM 15324]|nr:hypothetical protein AQJ58_17855 [Streptomyces sp. DSM 15324]